MNTWTKLTGLFLLGSAMCLAESWTGRLVDAACIDRQAHTSPTASCEPTRSTTVFAVSLPDGKVVKLDSAGNAKAAEAVATGKPGAVNVTITGAMSGDTVKVESLEIQK